MGFREDAKRNGVALMFTAGIVACRPTGASVYSIPDSRMISMLLQTLPTDRHGKTREMNIISRVVSKAMHGNRKRGRELRNINVMEWSGGYVGGGGRREI